MSEGYGQPGAGGWRQNVWRPPERSASLSAHGQTPLRFWSRRRQRAETAPPADRIDISPDLERDARRLAVELFLDEVEGFQELAANAAEAGRLRAAIQILREAGEEQVASSGERRFRQVWDRFSELDGDFFDKPAERRVARLATYSRLLREAAGE